MDAALEEMPAPRQPGDVEAAPLEDPRPRDRDVREAAVALRRRGLAVVQGRDESAAVLRDLGERVGLAALIDDGYGGPPRDRQPIGLEVPLGIGRAGVR